MSNTIPTRPSEVQRLLEGWLPLAQDANQQYGRGLDAPALETLILQAAPALHHARTSLEASAILWSTQARLYPGEPTTGS